MNRLLLAVSLISALVARADAGPLSLSGEYRYQGTWETAAIKDNEIVHAITDAERERLQALMAQGYACEAKANQTYRCSKFRQELSRPEWLGPRVERGYGEFRLSFGAPPTSVELVHDGGYQEWHVWQALTVNGRAYPFYRYLILSGGVHKVAAGTTPEAEDYFSIIVDSSDGARALHLVPAETLTTKSGFTQYFLNVYLGH